MRFLREQWEDLVPNILPTKPLLTLAAAKTIAAAAEHEATNQACSVTMAIVDDSGRLVYFQRMDDNANASMDMAIAKAIHAVQFRRPTRFHEALLDEGNLTVLGVPGMVPVEGGILLQVENHIVGAIGVSGARSDQDGIIAQAGAVALQAYLSM
jgi:glc operon protein GlcG